MANNNWSNIFSSITENVVFNNERYSEVQATFLEPNLAKAQISTIQTPGFELVQADFSTKEELTLVDLDYAERISSSFVLGGGLESQFSLDKTSVLHWSHTHSFHYTPDFSGKHIIHNGDVKAFSLSYEKAFFKSIAQTAKLKYLDKVLDCMDREETLTVPPGKMLLQPRIAELLNAITQCCFQGLTKYLFIEAKMLEIFALQIDQLNSENAQKEEWSSADKERLKAVHDYISSNYLEPLTLGNICYRFGLNEFKLKKGYKHFFGSTVFGHIQKLRMEAAQQLLITGQMNVSEVSLHIGYNNISSFSEAYKKFFGYLPGKISLRCSVI